MEGPLKDKDPFVRETTTLVLGELKATSSVPKLKDSLNDKGEVAFAAAKALGSLGDPAGRDFLIQVLAGERKDTAPGLLANSKHKAREDLHHPCQIIFMGAEDATGAMFGPACIVLAGYQRRRGHEE